VKVTKHNSCRKVAGLLCLVRFEDVTITEYSFN